MFWRLLTHSCRIWRACWLCIVKIGISPEMPPTFRQLLRKISENKLDYNLFI
ncbi:unnamed protein product [Acanthoscelides obtectus]|uniref:Uncharacterized protein n=1 Tax=Acanthoscelides obtectus TaxID=200917 RepID=A0A9P0PE60_ACAOB|nr:unnamed protein product [Acanthoscelides obtectus]CAK1641916.1 hypothetical protein AOBTE_LOCUS12722 [Acanthoscelides obtectus]